MNNIELEKLINKELNSDAFNDYAPNGLQVEGCPQVKKIVTGVTACQALLDAAVKLKADAIIVHHGYFWKNEAPEVRGMKKNRLKTLLVNDINLYGYHLPLDAHSSLGNNAQLGLRLAIRNLGAFNNESLIFHGELDRPQTGAEMVERIEKAVGRNVLHCGDNAPEKINTIAWCTGGGQGYIELAAERGVDAFISGEVSEQTIHIAREMGLHFFAAGHHATERYGVKALGEWLEQHHDFEVIFIDIDNPA